MGAIQLTVAEFSVMSEKRISFGEPMAVKEKTQEKHRKVNYLAHQRCFLDSLSRKIQPLDCVWAKPLGWRV